MRTEPIFASVNPFRTAVPFWGQTSQIISNLSPKRDCSPRRVKSRNNNTNTGTRPKLRPAPNKRVTCASVESETMRPKSREKEEQRTPTAVFSPTFFRSDVAPTAATYQVRTQYLGAHTSAATCTMMLCSRQATAPAAAAAAAAAAATTAIDSSSNSNSSH